MSVTAYMATHVQPMLAFPLFLFFFFANSTASAKPDMGVINLSFPPFTNAINCSFDASTGDVLPQDICTVSGDAGEVILSGIDMISARYQYATKVQLWSSKLKHDEVSFSTSFVIQIRRNSDGWNVGQGLAFAITPDQQVAGTGPESLGLFPIDDRTGHSLRGAKTVAVELDLSGGTGYARFPDPRLPHLGLDINSLQSVVTGSVGTLTSLVGRRLAVFIDYDAVHRRLEVRLQKLNNEPINKRLADLYISYSPFRLSDFVEEDSYIGFSSVIPKEEDASYILSQWKFFTKWVPIKA